MHSERKAIRTKLLNQSITQSYFTDQPNAWTHAQNVAHKSHGARRELRRGKQMQFIALDFNGHHGKLPCLAACDSTNIRSGIVHAQFFGSFARHLYMQSFYFIQILSVRARAA